MKELFHKISLRVSVIAGSPLTFISAFLIIILWASTGSFFHFSDTWQLIINTSTTIITFLMVFLIQNTQNRDSKAIHLKLDELLKGVKGARSGMIDVEELSDEDLEKLHGEFRLMHEKYAEELQRRGKKTK
jgi:low affinity Fe/Cu permease